MDNIERLEGVLNIVENDDNIEFIANQRMYVVRNRQNNFEKWSDKEFFDRFRFSKQTAISILAKIEHLLLPRQERYHSISPRQQFLIALRFYATGSFYITVGDFAGICKATVYRIINRVTNAIVTLRPNVIKMSSTENEMQQIVAGFYQIAQFPRVIGAIDGVLIRMQSPGGEQPELFRCRKGYFAFNVQAVCSADNKFLSIVARWPGSVHDSHAFNNSALSRDFENGIFNNYVVLGDSGYPLRTYLLTPILRPNIAVEELYNERHIRTRQVVERTFGIWKRRFPVLTMGMRCNIVLMQKIIIATAILHNFAVDAREGFEEYFEMPEEFEDIVNQEGINNNIRNDFIQYFHDMLYR